MRRRMLALILGVVLAGLAVAGCGSSSSGAPPNPMATSLSYFPAQTPFVMTVATKPSTQAKSEEQQLQAKLPQLSLIQTAARSKLQQLGINLNQDIKPLYANPIVFGDVSTSLNAFQDHFLVVWVTNDTSKLNALVKKTHVQAAGSHDGAKLYTTSGGGALAVTGPTILLAKTTADLTAALDRHANGGGITQSQYSTAVSGLPSDAAVHLYGNLTDALSTPQAAIARRVPWVAALRSYGATFGYSTSGLTVQFRLDTGGTALSASQLPFASGSTAAAVVNGLPVQVGLRDPSQIITFILGAEHAVSPRGYAHFLKQAATIKRRTGVDISTLANQFQGDLVVDSDTRTTLMRAAVTDPAALSKLFTKLEAGHGGSLGATKLHPVGGGFYHFTESGRNALLGLLGNQLVFGVAPKGGQLQSTTLRAFASAPGSPLPGASGAFSFRLSLPQLLTLTGAATSPNAITHEILGLLGDFSGSMSVTPAALTGAATLALK